MKKFIIFRDRGGGGVVVFGRFIEIKGYGLEEFMVLVGNIVGVIGLKMKIKILGNIIIRGVKEIFFVFIIVMSIYFFCLVIKE